MINPARPAATSLVASLLTVAFFCIGFLPIPLTAIPCYPAAFLAAMVALISGGKAILMARASGQPAGWQAWLGVMTGLFVMLAILCLAGLTLAAFPLLAEIFQQNQPVGGG